MKLMDEDDEDAKRGEDHRAWPLVLVRSELDLECHWHSALSTSSSSAQPKR